MPMVDAEGRRRGAVGGEQAPGFPPPSAARPAIFDGRLRTALRDGAQALGFSSIDLASGAGHDAAFMARICPAAMVFIPCRGGKSHAPEEWAERDAIAAGGAVMLHAIRQIDQTLPT